MLRLSTAVSGLNNNQAEPLELRQERSVFEHINGNFRSPVILAQNHVNGNVSNGTGIIDTPVETRVATNTSRVTVGDEKEEKTGMLISVGFIFSVSNLRESSQIYLPHFSFISLFWCTATSSETVCHEIYEIHHVHSCSTFAR